MFSCMVSVTFLTITLIVYFIVIAGSSHDLVTLPGDSDIESRSRSIQGTLSGLNPPSVNTSRPPSESDSSKLFSCSYQ